MANTVKAPLRYTPPWIIYQELLITISNHPCWRIDLCDGHRSPAQPLSTEQREAACLLLRAGWATAAVAGALRIGPTTVRRLRREGGGSV